MLRVKALEYRRQLQFVEGDFYRVFLADIARVDVPFETELFARHTVVGKLFFGSGLKTGKSPGQAR
ncbi:hypothetical protein D9M71_404410 [compost metagenome]